MPNEKTDSLGFATENSDQQRDMAAKGGPTTTLGKADAKHVAPTSASSDTQTEITADEKDTKESIDTDAEGIYITTEDGKPVTTEDNKTITTK